MNIFLYYSKFYSYKIFKTITNLLFGKMNYLIYKFIFNELTVLMFIIINLILVIIGYCYNILLLSIIGGIFFFFGYLC